MKKDGDRAMEHTIVNAYLLVEVVVVGAFMLLYPRIARAGLLFGVYVGEERSQSEAARAIARAWYRGMIAAIVLAVAVGLVFGSRPEHPFGMVAPSIVLVAAFVALYLRAYRQARRLAPEPGIPLAVAAVSAGPEANLALPWAVLAAGAVAGVCVIVYTVVHYGALPDPMPTHFGLMGQPDKWSKKSAGTVMVLPIMTLVMGVTLGGVAVLTGRAKRGLRLDDGSSLVAQNRYRAAMSRYLAVLGLLITTMLTVLSVTTVQLALGERKTLPLAVLFVGVAIFLFAMIGAAWLALHFGQGGARLENSHGGAPLTDGLADNRLWKLGAIYVNRDDPSWLVEHRFGLGYTLNFGNPKAVAAFVAFLAAIVGLAAWAIVSST
jgi:uncharacterized membrane protein